MAAAGGERGGAASREEGMAGAGEEEDGEENILYDLLVNTEWPPETEVQPRGNRKHGASFIITRAITGPALFLLRYIWYSPAKFSLPTGLVRLVNKQINWHLVLASNGKLLAVVQDQCVEIRSAKDDFGSIVGKCQVPKDPNPQWRRVAWSHDCTLLAYAESTGTVRVFDLMGSELLVISPTASFPGDLSYAIAGLIFLEYKASAQWSAELLVVNYRGELRSYLVSVGTNQSFQESHSFSFSSHYAHGITTVIYHPGHKLLLVGGCETDEDGVSKATGCGISAWRILSGSPHYKQVTSYEDDIRTAQRRGLLRIMNLRFYSRRGTEQDGVFKMNLSPDGALLAAVHFSGKLTIWSIPSLRQQGEWDQTDQPGYDEINPDWRLSSEKRKKIKDKESYYPLIDVNWWADNSVILARCSGALTVSSVKTLRNLLGKSCEWFESSPQVTSAHDGGFLSLECEIKLVPKRSRLESRPGDEDEGEDDSDSDDENSAKDRYFSYLKQGLYFVTEMERFAPPRKRPRTITKNFRLVSLRSTTPEELYQRKIDNEEYGEALSLAQAYGLDSDLVYQRQWRKSAVNVASIQDYLSKIKKRAWVLHECLERVPENVDAAKKLLQYGLKGTDLEALVAIGKGEDGGRFILPGEVDIEIPYEDLLSPEEEMDTRREKEAKKHQELLLSVNFSKLTLEQKELCRSRLKLLTYLDRLETYEEILGGPHAAEQNYDGEFFKKFRNQNIVLSARTYARESNVRALEILFTFHGSALLPHRQAILSNFPETTSPHEYAFLLPEACYKQGALRILPWNEQKHREEDWCEKAECRMIVEPTLQDEGEFLYEMQPELLKYRTTNLSVDLVTDWYLSRAQEIEKYAMQVDCALSLVRLGMERNIPGLQVLCDNLITLETIVYETDGDRTLTLKELVEMKDIEKLRLLMKNSSDEKYVKNVYQWMIPFLHRCENQSPGLANSLFKEYLVTLAKEDLTVPLKIFQNSKPACQQKIIPDQDQLMITALECIYSCERDDQLALCYDILECLPQRGYGPETDKTNTLHDEVDELEQILSVSELLEKHGLQKPVSFVKDTKNNAEEARKLMIRLTRHTGRKQPSVSETHWKELLQDMLDMQQKVYTCLHSDTCYEIFTESLLCSSSIDNIHLAGQMMHCSIWSVDLPSSSKGKPQYRVSYAKSIELVLAAGREYFNSSTSLTDSCMDLARCCLQLIVDCPSAIQEELDLIRALGYLEEFGVKILPLQVRLCSDRLSLIKDCLAQLSTNYRQSAKLLGLANLLRVAGDDQMERKGQVLILLVEQALSFQDYKAASMHCQELMATGYSKSWEVCSQLGQSEGYHDLSMRQELMAFALTHCPPSAIEALLGVSSSLQTQILYQAVNYQLLPSEGGENINISGPSSLISKDTEADPKELIQMVTKHVSQYGYTDWPEEITTLINQLHYYNERLLDFTQAQILQGLGKGVDVQRFTADGQYKRETILGLAETLEENVYKIAVSLAQRYNVPLWEVYMTHLEFLFTDSGLSTLEIEERAQSLGLFETLKTSPETLHEHMVKYVYPSIEGRDHQRLLYYFTLLENCGCSEVVKHAVKPETHIRLLKKFKAVAPGLNYKKLTDENENPLETLEPVLTSQNILSISKLGPKIPKKDGSMLSPSSIYAVWLQKLFWNGDHHLIKKIPETMDEWLHAYDMCSKYFDRLDPDDIVTFIDEITFSSKAVTKLPVEARIEVTEKAIKAVKHISEKSRKKPSENGMDDAESPSVTYEETLNHLQQSLAHLETLTHSFITYLKNSEQDTLRKYGYLYDLSRSEKEKIHDQAVAMCIDGQPLDMIQQLLQVAVGDLGLSPNDIVQCAIKKIVCVLSGSGGSSTSVKDPLGILEGIISAVHASVEKGEEVVSSDDLLEWLRPFCGDDSLAVKPRIRVLQILEQAFHLSDEDSKLLVYFRTQAVLRACWPETKVEITDIENEEKRYDLFLGLLESSRSPSEFQHLVLLLQAWPPMDMSNRSCTDDNPWVRLGTIMLQRCPPEEKENTGNEILKLCRSLYETKHMLPVECIKELCFLLLNQSLLLPSLKLLVESKDQDLHAVALEQITAVAKVDDSSCDAEILSLLLNAKLVVKCVSTAFYPRLIDHLLANQGEGGWDVEEIAKQLKEAGFNVEAGSLLMSHRGTHPALRTFTAALQAIQHWI
ncbi:NBAS subunit of NRZ tethering complex isoform X3 [Buteo buteo]|uniref:NBAS subunit of NRZ tethering complex isoform X3 n=1 Tax=Buteo buteo TaxID=30397 RepID=UPI003EBCE55E